MSRILKNEPFDAPVERFGSDVWHIAGKRCFNSAVKFWSSLIDEALLDYPGTTSFLVSASGETCYTRIRSNPAGVYRRRLRTDFVSG